MGGHNTPDTVECYEIICDNELNQHLGAPYADDAWRERAAAWWQCGGCAVTAVCCAVLCIDTSGQLSAHA